MHIFEVLLPGFQKVKKAKKYIETIFFIDIWISGTFY